MVDLHIYTTFSDGEYCPSEVVEMAHKKGITCLSITDQECIDGNIWASDKAKQLGIEYINGVEFSCGDYPGLHILGYNFDIGDVQLATDCERMQESRLLRAHQIIKYLQKEGFKIEFEEVRELSAGLIDRPHIARILVEKGNFNTIDEVFDGPLNRKVMARIGAFVFKYGAIQAIGAILDAGGYPVLADYTNILIDKSDFEVFFKHLVDSGLAGVEYDCSAYTVKNKSFIGKLAEKYKLIKTRGSGFKGEYVKPGIEIGTGKNNNLTYDCLNILQEFKKPIRRLQS